jgi:hypothetical protein
METTDVVDEVPLNKYLMIFVVIAVIGLIIAWKLYKTYVVVSERLAPEKKLPVAPIQSSKQGAPIVKGMKDKEKNP